MKYPVSRAGLQKKLKKYKRLLDYVSTYKNTFLRYHVSNIALHVESDAAYLVIPGAKHRVVGFYYFKEAPDNSILPQLNNPIHVE